MIARARTSAAEPSPAPSIEDRITGLAWDRITADLDAMCRRLGRIVELRDRDPLAQRMIPGFHIEGPFINETKGYRGAHPEAAIRPADADAMRRLLEAAGGLTKLVTLAPERDAGGRVTRLLAGQGIVVSAGRRTALAPTSSNTSTGSARPFTGTGPRAVTCTRPSTRRRVAALSRMLPGVANCSMRAARCVVSPTAE